MASIFLKNIKKSFKGTDIIKDVSLDILDGECTVLVGPSGCGKSTLLRIICGLEEVNYGEIFIGDECVTDLPPSHRGVTMVFQSYALYPHMTAFENMAFALKIRKVSKEQIKERVLNAARILKIENLLDRKPKELSGGQRQRVAIGRCIVRNPYAFLFDEPLSNLDASLRREMRYEIANLKNKLKTTMVYVTHDQEEAMTLADRIVVMRDGKIEQIGTPLEIYRSPVNTFVASFIGSPTMNLLPVKLVAQNENDLSFQVTANEIIKLDNQYENLAEGNYIIGIRPNDLEECSDVCENSLFAEVNLVENLGSLCCVYAKLSCEKTICVQTQNVNKKFGGSMYVKIKPEKIYLFHENGNRVEKKSQN